MTSCPSLYGQRPPPCSRIWSPVTPSSSGSIRSRPATGRRTATASTPSPAREWAGALDALAGGGDTPFVRTARDLEGRGDAALAFQIAELGLARHPTSAALQQIRQRALTTLRDIYSQTNPFRFIVYSEFAGRGLAPVGADEPATCASVTEAGDAVENAAQLDTGWRGYFDGNTLHIRNEERAVLIVRWCAQRQQRLSAYGRGASVGR